MKLSKKQAEWVANYKSETGFECIYLEDFERGDKTFEDFAQSNISWYESHTSDVYLRISNYPSN